ncbi:hypothetical protein B0H13DRAFT_1858803 [Mycena leptocephala]|nr:hypothetical protein B0H13DRAFT_1858803 [Mycena leptocephala]
MTAEHSPLYRTIAEQVSAYIDIAVTDPVTNWSHLIRGRNELPMEVLYDYDEPFPLPTGLDSILGSLKYRMPPDYYGTSPGRSPALPRKTPSLVHWRQSPPRLVEAKARPRADKERMWVMATTRWAKPLARPRARHPRPPPTTSEKPNPISPIVHEGWAAKDVKGAERESNRKHTSAMKTNTTNNDIYFPQTTPRELPRRPRVVWCLMEWGRDSDPLLSNDVLRDSSARLAPRCGTARSTAGEDTALVYRSSGCTAGAAPCRWRAMHLRAERGMARRGGEVHAATARTAPIKRVPPSNLYPSLGWVVPPRRRMCGCALLAARTSSSSCGLLARQAVRPGYPDARMARGPFAGGEAGVRPRARDGGRCVVPLEARVAEDALGGAGVLRRFSVDGAGGQWAWTLRSHSLALEMLDVRRR